MSCVWILQRGHSDDGCVLESTLYKYDLRKGYLFVLSWAMVRRLMGKYLSRAANEWWRCAQYFVIASCGWMLRDNRCMYMVHVCFYVCCSDCVGVCGNVCCVAAIVENSVLPLEC